MTAPVRLVEEREGTWLRVVLDRPPGNLLSLEMVRALRQAVADGSARQRKWLTLEGAGVDFSFGAMVQEHVPGPMETTLSESLELIRLVLELPCPTAALVRGRCLGGGFELALACDLVIAEEGATLGLPEIALAAFPPAGAALLPLRAGVARASEAVLTGAARTASEWHAAGVVAHVAPPDSLGGSAEQWFDRHLAPRSAVALAAASESSRLLLRAAAEPVLETAYRLYLERILPTEDAREGVLAFLEKRLPRWSHR